MGHADEMDWAKPSADWQKTAVGPPHGALVIHGGNFGTEVLSVFLELAGGPQAPIVVMPTARGQERAEDDAVLQDFRRAGAANVTVLNARDRAEADSQAFVEPLRKARGVWLCGGRQWRLADVYLHTAAHKELFALLDRGGVIGGSSAGASIQASYLVRGAPEGNHILMAEGHEEGFGFLRGVAIDQHLIQRSRLDDMLQVIAAHPRLLGIGIDERTWIVVRGDRFKVMGASQVGVYGAHGPPPSPGKPCALLNPGDVFDMRSRTIVTDTKGAVLRPPEAERP